MSGFAKSVKFDTLRSIAFGSVTGSYLPIGTAFGHIVRLMKIVNNTNADMFISFDGTNDHDYIPATSFALYDLTTNGVTATEFVLKIGTQVYVKQNTAPTSGSVFITCVYAFGE